MIPDDEFLRAFFGLTLPSSEFRHRDHLRLAWLAVRRHGGDVAEEVVASGISRFAQHNSHGPLYHDTMTRFWARLVAHAVSARPEILDFDEFLAAFPLLLDKNTPMRHWSRESMFAPEARAAWREPDLVALPF
jgi:N-formylglutamate deformylase